MLQKKITYSANNASNQINIKGYKQVDTATNTQIYSNGVEVEVVINGAFTATANTEKTITTISSEYAPYTTITNWHHNNAGTGRVSLYNNGSVVINGTVANPTVRTIFHYRKK